MSQDIFSIVPLEVIQDPRLTKRQIKVLIALLSFRGKNTNTVWPSRKTLSERCNLPITRISETTTQLVDLGWLSKDGKGGFSKSTRYHITVPDLTVTETVTVTKPVTVTKTVTPTVTKTVTGMGVTKTVTGKELTKNITIRTKSGNKRFIEPTIDEVGDYCLERNNSINADAFVSFYKSKGWMIGKNKMKCWKSAITNWETRQNQKNRSSHVYAATQASRGFDIDTGKAFTGLEQIEGLLN